ncbi:hypothetical protein GLOTRDRAFT_136615 [Gloeophyllum trabeum ATCC 11539]|uniref:Shieldin complex subunit 2 first OB fold domain-containing protein n=1 Tax=Gloeophyllum trabeum (strain ATCC 11539 / FP-39264 / Madison 617) TaxID=670483 RepID=S7RWK7_GLOTA|nr:uncharacterized protein GLOTRDRAFT_136615 [Gloeophyllum trabeum ATCC 11539]EPQ57719.1 hypothetical protein GLOTRDRAFT_136615 [Gloeophyllum trabeum ATCC 11539]
MPRYRVFLGAPPARPVPTTPTHHWQTITNADEHPSEQSLILPPATLEEAGRRVSEYYGGIIFDDSDEDDTTAISWPPSASQPVAHTSPSAPTSSSASVPSLLETQETSFHTYSDASSIAHFPAFHFSLHALTPLSSLPSHSRKVNTLVAVLEVDGPDVVRIKQGRDAGREVSVLRMIVGDERAVGKVTAWREVAEAWGGAVTRGDVVLLSNVSPASTPNHTDTPALTASPFLGSALDICYRSLPASRADARLRPDLRLARSDAAVRAVAAVVAWFQRVAGLSA